jgi:hypothetical protein
MPDQPGQEKVGRLRGLLRNIEDVLYGMAAHDMSRYAIRTRASMEHAALCCSPDCHLEAPHVARKGSE